LTFSSSFPSVSRGKIIIIIQASPISLNLACKDQFLVLRFQPFKKSKFNHSNHPSISLGCALFLLFQRFKFCSCTCMQGFWYHKWEFEGFNTNPLTMGSRGTRRLINQ
jgi:hypothetical protein